jgi:hypothetical protein
VDDREFVSALESCTLPPASFRHRDHVRLAFLYLREEPLLGALERYAASLKRYAASLGQNGVYHETITWAFIFLIHERMQRRPASSFEDFAQAHPDLFTTILDRYYRPETLASELARGTFLMPDAAAWKQAGSNNS